MRRLVLLAAAAVLSGADPAAETIARIAEVGSRLPWFWSQNAEGVADIPYTYDQRIVRSGPLKGAGRLSNWTEVRFERIPLAWGSHLRCLAVDGKSPCPEAWNAEIERQIRRRHSYTPEERARMDQARADRRARRRAFWTEFPKAFRFQSAGGSEIRFSPNPGNKGEGLLGAISGRLIFDSSTHEITALEYETLRAFDEPARKLPKGSRFRIVLMRFDGHYVPQRIISQRKGEIPTTVEYSNYRRFESASTIEFVDK